MTNGGLGFLRSVLAVLVLTVSTAVVYPAQIPLCVNEGTPNPNTIRKATSWDIPLEPPEIGLIFRAISLPEVVVEARFGDDGTLACYSPLSGWSIYWDSAVLAVKRELLTEKFPSGSSQIFVFDDLGHSAVQMALDSARGSKRCIATDTLETLLTRGLAYLTSKRVQDAEKCYGFAIRVAPGSVAANYGAARVAGLGDRQADRIAWYEKTVQVAPWFYEARIELAYAYSAVERLDAAMVALQPMITDTPLPIRKRSYEALILLLDKEKRRTDAAQAKKSYVDIERQLRSRYQSLIGEAVLAFDTKDLAVREEEIGDYRTAVRDFEEAVQLSNVDSVSEAVRFQAGLGRLRNTKRLGNAEEAAKGCEEWHKRLSQLGRQLNDSHWSGKAVTMGQWEASCGDFNKAISVLNAEIKRVPDSDVAYRALESVYRSAGKSDLADRAKALAERVRTEHDRAILKSILAEAEQLTREGNAVEIKK